MSDLPDNVTYDVNQPAAEPDNPLDAEIKTVTSSEAYRDRAHPEHEATVEKAKGLFEKKYPASQDEIETDAIRTASDTLAEMRTLYGSAFDQLHDRVVDLVTGMGEEATTFLEVSGLGNDKDVVGAFFDLASGYIRDPNPVDARRFIIKIDSAMGKYRVGGQLREILAGLRTELSKFAR